MAEFGLLDKTDYPLLPQPKQANANSASFVLPYKVATGNTRGDLRLKGVITVVDDNNVVRLIAGFKKDAF